MHIFLPSRLWNSFCGVWKAVTIPLIVYWFGIKTPGEALNLRNRRARVATGKELRGGFVELQAAAARCDPANWHWTFWGLLDKIAVQQVATSDLLSLLLGRVTSKNIWRHISHFLPQLQNQANPYLPCSTCDDSHHLVRLIQKALCLIYVHSITVGGGTI